MKEKYKDNIAYLYKKVQNVDGVSFNPTWETDGIPFYCNVESISRRVQTHGANGYKTVQDDIIKTTTQLDFANNDKISFERIPYNDVNASEFSIIQDIDPRPYMQKGNKYRTQKYYEYWIKTT